MFGKKVSIDKHSGSQLSLAQMAKRYLVFFMVGINGVLITTVTFFVMNFFVDQMVQDENSRVKSSVEKIIESDTQQLAGDLNMLSSLMSTLQESENFLEQIKGLSKYKPLQNKLDQGFLSEVYFLYFQDGKTNVTRLYGTKEISAETIKKYIGQISLDQEKIRRSNSFVLISKEEIFPLIRVSEVPDIMSRSHIFVKEMKGNGRNGGFILSVLDAREHAMFSDIAKMPESAMYIITDEVTGVTTYRWVRNANRDLDHSISFSLYSGVEGNKISVKGYFDTTSQVSLLKVMPWMALIFLGSLTFFVMVFIWKSQKSANFLEKINKELEQKNHELGTEVNERERLNHILRKSERENQAIINGISDIIFEMSLNGEILFLNEAWERLTGSPVEESIGKNLFEMIHPKDQDEQRKSVSQLIKGLRSSYRIMTSIHTGENKYRSVEMAISMIRMDENRNMRVVGSFSDMDDRQKAEWALTEAERKYRSIWENSANGIYQVTKDGKIISANPAMAKIFGYDSPDALMAEVQNAHNDLFVDKQQRKRCCRELKKTGYVRYSSIRPSRKTRKNSGFRKQSVRFLTSIII